MDGNQDEPKSLLSNLRGHHIVHVHNPLSSYTDAKGRNHSGDFTWPIARSITELDPRYKDPYIEKMGLRNDSHPTQKHVRQEITIPSGKSLKMPGDVAQVYVAHLVDEVIARSGQKALGSNPEIRRETEEQVILNINDLRNTMSTTTIESQLEQQLADMNREETTTTVRKEDEQETAFPTGLRPTGSPAAATTGRPEPATADKQSRSQAPSPAK